MCIFSQSILWVANTQIFARPGVAAEQYLVYRMEFDAAAELAMILPLPVPVGVAEDAVRFISLEEYPDFFDDLDQAFAQAVIRGLGSMLRVMAEPLAVITVGSFEASFVPTLADFARLDERFRLPKRVWDRLPEYRDYGFAVFQLRAGHQRIHPMAFSFPRAEPDRLFFPTVHLHQGRVHKWARFDHALYAQDLPVQALELSGWQSGQGPVTEYVDIDRAEGLIDAEARCFRRTLKGYLQNQDTWVEPAV